MNQLLIFLIFIFSCFIFPFPLACFGQNPYNLQKPDESYTLPGVLHEISGITAMDANRIACIQNDQGIIYLFNLSQKRLTKEFKFGSYGDYEGITKAGSSLFVLRSDGRLFEISGLSSQKHLAVNCFRTKIPAINDEGICYDFKGKRLLIISNSGYINLDTRQKSRPIFSIDIYSKYTKHLPAFSVYLPEIQHRLAAHHLIVSNETNNWENLFKPSDIAINPLSGMIYILSAKERLIYRFSRIGKLISIETLSPELFPDAEGIGFLRNGTLIIANAGNDKRKANLLIFKCKKRFLSNSFLYHNKLIIRSGFIPKTKVRTVVINKDNPNK